ncbi:MAG: hypothetical protein V5A85_03290 [Haloarculaceae archaeon]
MPPSRRTAMGAALTALAAPIAGCTTLGGADDGNGASTPDDGGTGSPAPDDGGTFEVRLRGPWTDRRLFDGSEVASVGSVRDRTGSAGLPVTLTDEASADVAERFRAVGVPGTSDEFEVVQFHDGEAVGRFGIAPGLVEAIADGEWDGRLLLTFGGREQAVDLRETLADDGG